MCLVDGDHPLRSDDPYLVGLLFGGLAAFLSATIALADFWFEKRRGKSVAYLIVCGLWCSFWTAAEFTANEGQGVGFSIMTLGLLVVAATWLYLRSFICRELCRWHPTRLVSTLLSIFGGLFLLLYLYVATCVLM